MDARKEISMEHYRSMKTRALHTLRSKSPEIKSNIGIAIEKNDSSQDTLINSWQLFQVTGEAVTCLVYPRFLHENSMYSIEKRLSYFFAKRII